MMKNNKHGFTLVEMIVTFMLLVIFMGCTVAIIGASLKVYSRDASMSRALSVSDALLTEIETQVSRASSDLELTDNAISFRNEEMTREIIYIKNSNAADESGGDAYDMNADINDETTENNPGELSIRYEQGRDLVPDESDNVDWYYSEKEYLRNKITGFTISDISVDSDRPVLKVEMELTSDYGYQFTESRIIKCYSSVAVKKVGQLYCE